MRKLKLAVVQPALAEGECAANWRAARAALERAGSAGADLVVLPEMWLTGYAYRRLDELAKLTPESLARVGALARKYGYFVAGSWAERNDEGRLTNTACIVGPDGRVRARYRKVHLFGPMKEDRHFAAGVNRAGRSVSVLFGGGSAVVGPRGDFLAQLGPEEGFAEVEIDLDEVAATREQITYLADRAREVDEFLYR